MIVKYGGRELKVDFVEEMAVVDLKTILSGICGVEVEGIRLVTSGGKVLKVNEMPLSFYGIDNDSATLFMYGNGSIRHSNEVSPVIADPTLATTTTLSLKQQQQEKLKQRERDANPLMGMEGLLDMVDPNLLHHMFMSNPKIQQMIEKQPELRHLFNDPKFIKQMMKASSNPELMLQMQKSNDLALAQLENIPGGFQALTSFYKDIQEPLESMGKQDEASIEERNQRNLELQMRLNVQPAPEDRINNVPLPNPWAKDSQTASSHFPQSFNAMPMGGFNNNNYNSATSSSNNNNNNNNNIMNNPFTPFGRLLFQPMSQPSAASSPSVETLRVRYNDQIDWLVEMGYEDREENLTALIATGGDMYSAVDALDQKRQPGPS